MTQARNKLGDGEIASLCEAVAPHPTLQVLDISANVFQEAAGRHLSQLLLDNTSLVELNLSWNNLKAKGAAALAEGLAENDTLGILDLGWNGVGDAGCNALSAAIRSNTGLVEVGSLSYTMSVAPEFRTSPLSR